MHKNVTVKIIGTMVKILRELAMVSHKVVVNCIAATLLLAGLVGYTYLLHGFVSQRTNCGLLVSPSASFSVNIILSMQLIVSTIIRRVSVKD